MNNTGSRALGVTIGTKAAGFVAITLVVLLLMLATLALIGPYQVALAEWHSIQRVIAN